MGVTMVRTAKQAASASARLLANGCLHPTGSVRPFRMSGDIMMRCELCGRIFKTRRGRERHGG